MMRCTVVNTCLHCQQSLGRFELGASLSGYGTLRVLDEPAFIKTSLYYIYCKCLCSCYYYLCCCLRPTGRRDPGTVKRGEGVESALPTKI